MVEIWAKLQVIFGYVIPGIFLVVVLIFGVVCFGPFIIRNIRRSIEEKKKLKLLSDAGFERYLYDVASVGNGEFYAWRKNGKFIRERNLREYSISELEEWIKGVNNAS